MTLARKTRHTKQHHQQNGSISGARSEHRTSVCTQLKGDHMTQEAEEDKE